MSLQLFGRLLQSETPLDIGMSFNSNDPSLEVKRGGLGLMLFEGISSITNLSQYF